MIAIVGGKGGCGKSTTTLGVARVLRQRGCRVRAVDADTGMPNLHRLADVEREPTLSDLFSADRAAGPTEDVETDRPGEASREGTGPVPDAIRDRTGVEVVPAPRAPVDRDIEASLHRCSDAADVTLVDTAAGAGPDVAAPLRAADAAVLVATDRSQSVEDAAKTREMASSLDAPVLGAVLTRTSGVSHETAAALGVERVAPIPDADEPLSTERVLGAYGTVVDWIERWRAPDRHSRPARTTRGAPGDRATLAGRRGQRTETGRTCPECGRPAHGDAATGRPGRRSRRSRVRRGTRSSSRGGGAPSGPR